MNDKDIKFFKIITIIICLAICLGVGYYINKHHESQQDKVDRLSKQLQQDLNSTK
jgi:hypothetical protein